MNVLQVEIVGALPVETGDASQVAVGLVVMAAMAAFLPVVGPF